MSLIFMCTNKSHLPYSYVRIRWDRWDMTYLYIWIWKMWLIRKRDVTHSYARCDSFIRETWLIHTCNMAQSCVWHDFVICVIWHLMCASILCDAYEICVMHMKYETWLIHMCDMTQLCVWYDFVICVTWHLMRASILCDAYDLCDITHSYVRHDSFACATWLSHTCDMTSSYVWHDAWSICWFCVIHIHMWDMTQSMWDVTHSNVTHKHCSHHKCEHVMSHARLSHVTLVNGHVMSVRMSHVTHIRMSHVTHIRMRHVAHIRMNHVTLIRMSHVTHIKMSHVTHMWHV